MLYLMLFGIISGNRRMPLQNPLFGLLLCSILSIISSSVEYQQIPNKWKTGPWSTCHSLQECGEGWQSRNVFCISSAPGLILREAACDVSVKPSTNRDCFKVCQGHKHFLRWSVGRWLECLPSDQSSPCKDDQLGEANREVRCLLNSTEDGREKAVSNSICEYFWTQPRANQVCSLECPQDCIIIDDGEQNVGDWEPKLESSEIVLVAPSPRGLPCSRNKSPCLNGQQCVVDREEGYILKVHEWGPCLSIEESGRPYDCSFSMFPTLGRTARNITCLNNQTGEIVDLRLCSTLEQHVEQLCVVSSDCEASPWSEWKVEREGCRNTRGIATPEIRSRVRDLVKGAVGGGALCGPLFEQRVIVENLPPCEKYRWLESEWGECVLYTHYKINEVSTIIPKCGGGVQVRNLTCIRVLGSTPVNDSMCLDPKPPHVQRCSVQCIRNCKVSHWSKWGPCLPFDDELEHLNIFRYGVRTRSRTILIKASEHGKECPHLIEQIICDLDEDLFDFHYGEWSDCLPQNSRTQCGIGERTRDFTCLANGNMEKQLLCQNVMKNELMTPDISERCHIPCPSDCVLSEWSEWTLCSDETTNITTSNRTELAIEDYTGNPCHRRRQKERKCAKEPTLKLIYWKVKLWSQCLPQNGSCGQGIRKRKIVCNRGVIFDRFYSCEEIPKPAEEQPCFFPCPVDCIATKFSDWSTCPSPCSIEIQSRDRFVLNASKHGGKPCPVPLRETRLCSFNSTACLSYSIEMSSQSSIFKWETGNWSNCILPVIDHRCGTGFQIRNVSCVNVDSKAVEMHWCTRSSINRSKTLAHLAELIPAHFRLCHVMCPLNKLPCTLSAWSSWTECSHHYFQPSRSRTREFIGESVERADCRERYALREENICPRLESKNIFSGPLGSCIIENHNRTLVAINSQVSLLSCGVGYKYRAGLQMEGLDAVEQGVEKDLCVEECPLDCQMSKWTTWTQCNVTCGQGYRSKNRRIVKQSNAYGRPCPPNLDGVIERQTEVCEVLCLDYSWIAYGWENCTLLHSKNSIRKCGNGRHQRSVRCIETEKGRYADDKYCDSVTKPISEGPCRIHCPGECVMSEWEVRKPCFNPCRPNDIIERRRRILRAPNHKHSPCPPDLVERKDCVLNDTCFTFSWKLGMWSSCVLPEGAMCGEGIQRKARVCERSDGRQVDGVHCEKKEGLQKTSNENLLSSQPCYVDCPIDCVVSEWTNWDSTSCRDCGKAGMMIRVRKILQTPSDAGQPCPAKLELAKPCPFKPCYHWRINWSDCDLTGMTCGTGVRRRLVGCVRYDGLKVDKLHCLVTNITFPIKDWLDPKWLVQGHDKEEEETCYVQCPGDCILSEWSEWSHCHKDCNKGQKIGYKTSSRFIIAPKSITTGLCSEVLIRALPCWDAKCYSFGWKYQNNSLHCERSDGLIVKGGCTNTRLLCHPSCETAFRGNCDPETGDCFCEFMNGERKLISPEMGDIKQVCDESWSEVKRSPKQPANHTAPTQMTILKYYPDDRVTSFWMYAMISIGTAFVIFVGVTIYLMCRSSIHRRMASVHRQASVRRRELNNQEKSTYGQSTAIANKSYE